MIGWTTFGSSVAPIVLLVFGLLLAGSSTSLSAPRSARTRSARWPTLLPTWFLVPFAIVAVLGLVGGSVLDIYSSGLALLTVGLRVPRFVAALIDGTIMIGGTIYVVFFAGELRRPVRGLPDHARGPDRRLVRASCWPTSCCAAATTPSPTCTTRGGRYGDVRWFPVGLIVVGTALGWGLVTNAARAG